MLGIKVQSLYKARRGFDGYLNTNRIKEVKHYIKQALNERGYEVYVTQINVKEVIYKCYDGCDTYLTYASAIVGDEKLKCKFKFDTKNYKVYFLNDLGRYKKI